MLTQVANALLWISMLYGIFRIEDWGSQRRMYLARVWMIFTTPLLVVMVLSFSPCLSNFKDFVCHRYLEGVELFLNHNLGELLIVLQSSLGTSASFSLMRRRVLRSLWHICTQVLYLGTTTRFSSLWWTSRSLYAGPPWLSSTTILLT